MITTSVNIAIIIIMLSCQSSTVLTFDSDLWFPKEFPEDRLIKCGRKYEMFGLSIVDDHIFQFEKCAVIIYPPPLKKRLERNLKQLKLENGYRYKFDELLPNWQPNYCEYAKQSVITPSFTLLRLNQSNIQNNNFQNHLVLYFMGKLNKSGRNEFYIYDFDVNLHMDHTDKRRQENLHFIILYNGQIPFHISNSMYNDRFELTGDYITDTAGETFDFICIRDVSGGGHVISRQTEKYCRDSYYETTFSRLEKIFISFYAYERILMISIEDNVVYITYPNLLEAENLAHEYPLNIISLSDFFFCSSNTEIKPNEITTESNVDSSKKGHQFTKIVIPIIIVVVIIILSITIVMVMKYSKKKKQQQKNIKPLSSSTSSSSSSTSLTTTLMKTQKGKQTSKTNLISTKSYFRK